MTRARSLKKTIRARAAKTGESYTTARRHILAARAKSSARQAPPPTSAVLAPPKGAGISEARIRDLTGHGFDHWFAVLDAFGAATKGHRAAAEHLYAAHGVPGWHAQGITVAYERARGLRTVNQRMDGTYEVSVSKVLPAAVRDVVAAVANRRRRAQWLDAANPAIAAELGAALDGSAGTTFAVKDDNNARLRYRRDAGSVELRLSGRPGKKTSIVASNTKLKRAADVAARRRAWRAALDGLHRYLAT